MGEMEIRGMSQRLLDAMDEVDRMPREMRACVHEFGLPIVRRCLQLGISKPGVIRDLVKEIWAGARENGARQSGGVEGTLEWLLCQRGGAINLATLHQVLASFNYALVPMHPTRAMLDASMAAVCPSGPRLSKEEKHRRQLRAAIMAESAKVRRHG